MLKSATRGCCRGQNGCWSQQQEGAADSDIVKKASGKLRL